MLQQRIGKDLITKDYYKRSVQHRVNKTLPQIDSIDQLANTFEGHSYKNDCMSTTTSDNIGIQGILNRNKNQYFDSKVQGRRESVIKVQDQTMQRLEYPYSLKSKANNKRMMNNTVSEIRIPSRKLDLQFQIENSKTSKKPLSTICTQRVVKQQEQLIKFNA